MKIKNQNSQQRAGVQNHIEPYIAFRVEAEHLPQYRQMTG